jgi:hypothetical protein
MSFEMATMEPGGRRANSACIRAPNQDGVVRAIAFS